MGAVELPVGRSVRVDVVARKHWNGTGVMVRPGQRYSFAATGKWNDGGIPCDATGFAPEDAPAITRWLVKAGAPYLRFDNRRYFCLIGSVGRARSSFFPIGGGLADWSTASLSGSLECFANDVWIAYWNNRESVQLVVTRLA